MPAGLCCWPAAAVGRTVRAVLACALTELRASPWLQALFAECADGKLHPAFQSHLALLKAAGKDAPGQVAHLVALEHLLSQRLPPSEVRTLAPAGILSCMP